MIWVSWRFPCVSLWTRKARPQLTGERVITDIFKNCYLFQSVKKLLGGRAISGIAAIICKWLKALKCWYAKRKRWKSDYKLNVLIIYTKALKFAGKRITLNSNVTHYLLVITQRVLCGTISRPGDDVLDTTPLKPGADSLFVIVLEPSLFSEE